MLKRGSPKYIHGFKPYQRDQFNFIWSSFLSKKLTYLSDQCQGQGLSLLVWSPYQTSEQNQCEAVPSSTSPDTQVTKQLRPGLASPTLAITLFCTFCCAFPVMLLKTRFQENTAILRGQ